MATTDSGEGLTGPERNEKGSTQLAATLPEAGSALGLRFTHATWDSTAKTQDPSGRSLDRKSHFAGLLGLNGDRGVHPCSSEKSTDGAPRFGRLGEGLHPTSI